MSGPEQKGFQQVDTLVRVENLVTLFSSTGWYHATCCCLGSSS